MTSLDDSTFETWQTRVQKFLMRSKRLRTAIITTSQGLSGLEISKDHSSEELATLTALLGAFYDNMVELRKWLHDAVQDHSNTVFFPSSRDQPTLEIGFGYVLTQNGASHKHFVSLTNCQEFENRSTLTSFLAARGRDHLPLLNKWLHLYDEMAPVILELDQQKEWSMPKWDFSQLYTMKTPSRAQQQVPYFWTSVDDSSTATSTTKKIKQYCHLLILALQDMLAFHPVQGLWFEHHVISSNGTLHPQYFVFLFPQLTGIDFKEKEDRLQAGGTFMAVLPLTLAPKWRAFMQLLIHSTQSRALPVKSIRNLMKQWRLPSKRGKILFNDSLRMILRYLDEKIEERIVNLLAELRI